MNRTFWKTAAAYLVMFTSVPVAWMAAVRLSHLPAAVLPPPSQVWNVFRTEHHLLWYHTSFTLYEALLGYAVANGLAIFLALLFVYVSWSESFVTPWALLIKNIPFVTVAGVLSIVMGDTLAPKLIVVVLASFFPILANLSKGLRSAEPVLLERMHSLNASRWETLWKVQWPAALPYYVAAHEIAFTGSIIAAIVAEWFLARRGLGFLIVESIAEYHADLLFAVMLISSALSIGVYVSCRLWEHWIFRWRVRRKPSSMRPVPAGP